MEKKISGGRKRGQHASKIDQAKKNMQALTQDGMDKGRKRLQDVKAKKAVKPEPGAHNRLKALQPWHIELIRDRYVFDMTHQELAEKYGTSRAWSVTVCKSDVGIKAANEIINNPDVGLIRNKLKLLSGKAFKLCEEIIDGSEKADGITKIERGRFAMDLMKMAGIQEATKHKFEFEHIFKRAGDVVEQAGRIVEATVTEVSNETIKEIVFQEDNI